MASRLLTATLLVLSFTACGADAAPFATRMGAGPFTVATDRQLVEVEGNVRTGILAPGGETTGTILAMADGVYELDLTELALESAQLLDGKRVRVKGFLTVEEGIEIARRYIFHVKSYQIVND